MLRLPGSVIAVVVGALLVASASAASASVEKGTEGFVGAATIQPAPPLPGPRGEWTVEQCDAVLSAFAANLSPLLVGAVRFGGQGPTELAASYGSQYRYLRRQYKRIMGKPHRCRQLLGGPLIVELDQAFIGR